jgi:hypothetical protein
MKREFHHRPTRVFSFFHASCAIDALLYTALPGGSTESHGLEVFGKCSHTPLEASGLASWTDVNVDVSCLQPSPAECFSFFRGFLVCLLPWFLRTTPSLFVWEFFILLSVWSSVLLCLFVFRVRKLHVRSETRLRVTIGLFPLHVGFCGPDRSIGGWRRRRAESLSVCVCVCVCVCVYDDGF